jgi:hypothetical protein
VSDTLRAAFGILGLSGITGAVIVYRDRRTP